MEQINFNYHFDITILSNSISANEGILVLEIPIKGYLPGEKDHISYDDYLIIERNIRAVVQPLLSGELILGEITQRPEKYTLFNREHFSILCKIKIKKIEKRKYHANLWFTKNGKSIYSIEEFLFIK